MRVHVKLGYGLADTTHCTARDTCASQLACCRIPTRKHVPDIEKTCARPEGIGVDAARSSDAHIVAVAEEGGIAAGNGEVAPRGTGVAGTVVAGSARDCDCGSAPRILVWADVQKILILCEKILVLVADSCGIPVPGGWVRGRCTVVQACRCPGTSLCA